MPLGKTYGGGGGGGGFVGYEGLTGGRPAPAGQFVSSIGGKTTLSPGVSPQQQAALDWLQGASGMNQSLFNMAMGNANAMNAMAGGDYGYSNAVGSANRGYDLDVRGINEALLFGEALRNQEKYRNVDLGRSRSYTNAWDATQTWNILKDKLYNQRAFMERGFGLANQAAQQQYGTNMRGVDSDAIARGARTAAGTLANFGDVRQTRDQTLAGNQLERDRESSAIDTAWWTGDQANWYAQTMHGIELDHINSLAETYGLQSAQAFAQAELAKDRADANRDSAIGSAAANRSAGRASALAAQQAQRTAAYRDYMQNQMGLMQQAASFGG